MDPFTLPYIDVSGGMNLGPQPSDIQDNEASSLINFLPLAGELRRRPGFNNLSDQRYIPNGGDPSELTSLLPWSGGYPKEWDLFAGAEESIARWNHETGLFQRVPRTEFASYQPYSTSREPWSMLQYKQIIYAFRRDVGMRRVSRFPYHDSPPGIPAPLTAPTLATGGPGQIPSASFKGMVTFYNTFTGAESNPGPASATLVHAGPAAINWSNLPSVAPVPQVNAIRLWRTLPNEVGSASTSLVVGYLVAQLPIGTLSYVDNFLADQLGDSVSFKNAVPPVGLRSGVIWQERLWTHDGRNLYASEIGLPESIPAVNVLQVFPDDGQDIVGLAADETKLYVGKTSSVIYFTGSLPNLERNVLDKKNGVVSHHTMQAASGRLIWVSPSDVLISEGGPGRSLQPNNKLRLYMESRDTAEPETEVATIWPEKKLYIWLGRFRQTFEELTHHPHPTRDRDMLAVNYETGAWTTLRVGTGTTGRLYPINFITVALDWENRETMFAAWGAFLERMEQGLVTDDQAQDTGEIATEAFRATVWGREIQAPPGHLVSLRTVWLDSTLSQTHDPTSPLANRFHVMLSLNGRYGTSAASVHRPATNNVFLNRDVRVFSVKNLFSPASKILVGFDRYGIEQPWDVFGYGWTGTKWQRRHRPET